MIYSEKFKDRMVRRMAGPSGVSATSLAKEVGVPQSTLSRWLRGSVVEVSDQDGGSGAPSRERQERSPLEKAALVVEADKLEGEQLGAFLRQNGLHEADLEEMRRWLGEQLDPTETRREKAAARKAQQAQQKRIKKLERELRRKDKALAEAAALLVLQKKAREIWGDADDDTEPTSGD